MQVLTGAGERTDRMVFSPDGRYLAAGAWHQFRLWDLSAEPEPLWSGAGGTFAFSADGAGVVAGSYSRFLWYDLRTGEATLEPALDALNPGQFSPDSRFALAVTNDRGQRVVGLRCARTGSGGWWNDIWRKEIPCSPHHDGTGLPLLLFSADGNCLVRVFGGRPNLLNVSEYDVVVMDSDTGESVAEWSGELPAQIRKGAAGPTGTVGLLHNRMFYVIAPSDPRAKPVKRLNASPKHFTSAAFSRDGSRLATISNDTAATIWDTATWEVRRRYAWDIGRLRTVCFAPDGLRCAVGGDTGQVVVWDLDD
jgi:WD40 repeat protein